MSTCARGSAPGRRAGRALRHCRLYTSDEQTGVIGDAAVVCSGEQISWTGRDTDLPSGHYEEETDLGGALVTAGLIDAHTHPLYGGERFAEIALRSAGVPYSEIAARGGGIASSVAATRATSPTDLAHGLERRLAAWRAGGATTIEAKTGYHLDQEGELFAVSLLSGHEGVEVTFLGGHAVGPEWAGDPDGYAAEVARWSALARQAGARHADVFCDEGYFTVDQSRLMLEAARRAGLIPRIHADELALTGGAQLAAELGCASADHLLRVDDAGIGALCSAGVVATLAPVTALAMGRRPPARQLIEAGVTVALGSDHNPGTCGTTSMSLVMALAVAELGLSVDEALVAATAGGARSLRLADRGQVVAGLRADLVAWEADHEGAFAWSYGLATRAVWVGGRRVTG
ncbi:MAG: imidazolonepropionase [Acidimicrobiales bacterium]